jgi:hypothetical protein
MSNMKPVIKVDRVSSIEEAERLESCGVDIIGVFISEDVRFGDDRKISKQLALDIQRSLSSAKLCCQLFWDSDLLEFAQNSNFDFIQLLEYELPKDSSYQLTKESKMRIVYSGISASYDDEPSSILDGFENEVDFHNCYFHIDLLAHMEKSWSFLKEECPKYPDALQIKDVQELSERYPILIGLNPSSEDIIDCIKTIPSAKGFNFSLANLEPISNNVHWIYYSQLINILDKMYGLMNS